MPRRSRTSATLFWLSASLLAGASIALACTGDDPVFGPNVDAGGDGEPADVASEGGAPPCDPTKPFDPPVPVSGLATPDRVEMSARFSPDERTAYFNDEGLDGGYALYANIYVANRASTAVGFGPPAQVALLPLSTSALQYSPTVTADGVLMFFGRYTTDDAGAFHGRIWSAKGSAGTSAQFVGQAAVAGPVNQGDSQDRPYVLPDGHALYFGSTRGGSGPRLYRAALANGVPSDVQPVPGIQAAATGNGNSLSAPVVTADELTIYWSASIADSSTQTDVYVATRTDTSAPFSGARAVAELNTPLEEEPTFISADGCRLYYSSFSIDNTALHGDIFVATKPK